MQVESLKSRDISLIGILRSKATRFLSMNEHRLHRTCSYGLLVSGLLTLSVSVFFSSCREEQVSYDPSLRLTLSVDSLAFDTVFTGFGTSTQRVTLYNTNANALTIESASLQDGRFFRVNIDGEADSTRWKRLTIRGKDSAFIYVRVYVDPIGQNNPLIISDKLLFRYNGNQTSLSLSAIGQDVTVLHKADYSNSQRLRANKPYLVMDTLIFRKNLTIDAGATLYMHNNAAIFALGNVTAKGTIDEPIIIRGHRTDRLFDSVPYAYASGQWNGIYMLHAGSEKCTYTFQFVDVLSGNVGLFCQSENTSAPLPKLTVYGCRIHNMSVYGLVCLNTDATIVNNEISNCASHGIYLQGGSHTLVHNTVAAYFGYPYTNLNIHSAQREDVAAVYINNLSKQMAPMETYMYNNIITGARANCLVLAAPMQELYTGEFRGNYLRADSFALPQFSANRYAKDDDTVFVNNHYLYKEYRYFDFHLDAHSPVIGIGEADKASLYPQDREGVSRTERADAGCYQLTP